MTNLTNVSYPTVDLLSPLLSAFEEFNHHLFDDRLPRPVITVVGRRGGAMGSFGADRFMHRHDGQFRVDEIRLNPIYFASHGDEELLQTIGHEMVHQEQYHFGKPGKSGYHNRAWADRMEEIGLMPSSTGAPGGKRTGRSISDYIIPGGRFEGVANGLLRIGWTVPWARVLSTSSDIALIGDENVSHVLGSTPSGSLSGKRVKYSCRNCEANAWAKPALPLVCGRCSLAMTNGTVRSRNARRMRV